MLKAILPIFSVKRMLFWSILTVLSSACEQVSKDSSALNQGKKIDIVKKGQSAETIRMVEELSILTEDRGLESNYYRNRKLVQFYAKKYKEADSKGRKKYWFNYCRQLLLAGEIKTCLEKLEPFFSETEFPHVEQLTKKTRPVFELLALAHLRLGERENCQLNHSSQSCIVPLKEEGFHQLKEGSQKAIKIYEILMEKFPDPTNMWILNVAHMTLGTYPQSVPPRYLLDIPSKTEQKQFPLFKDVAMYLGLAQDGLAGSTCIDDFNNDGFLDIFATSSALEDNVQLFMNDKKGGFINVTASSGLEGILGGFNCIHADYNNDGYKDIFVLRGGWLGKAGKHPNSLLKNMGDGTFQDVTRSANILSYHPTQTASWADYDNDGHLDLFIGNESKKGDLHPCELYRNNGNGTFSELGEHYGLAFPAFVKSVSWGDIDNDGWMDLYVSRLGGENLLFRNDRGSFTEIGEKAGVRKPTHSFPSWFWDVNNDGLEDLLVLTYDLTYSPTGQYVLELQGSKVPAEMPKLYMNNGDGTFLDKVENFGLSKSIMAMGANFGDLDNDGFLDFYAGTGAPRFTAIVPNRMFRNVDGNGFEEVTSAGNFGHIQKGHGIAFADIDRDGDQDIYAVMGGFFEGDNFTNVLYENPISTNNWIVIELEGTKTNRSAIGVKVELTLNDNRKLYRRVNSGGSFGASPLQLEIGLGKASQIEEVKVFWPNKESQVFRNIKANQKILIKEGVKVPQAVEYNPVPFNVQMRNHIHS